MTSGTRSERAPRAAARPSNTSPSGARWAFGLLVAVLLSYVPPARAHYVGTALLHLVEQSELGQFSVRFIPSTAMRRGDAMPVPVYPPQCRMGRDLERDRLACDAPGLTGELHIDGLNPSAELIVQIDWRDGRRSTHVLTGQRDRVVIEQTARSRGAQELFLAYGRLGVEHIAEGVDHLSFVLGLVLLVGFRRGLLWAISGFTLAHSLTLALSVTGLIVLRPLPVEALIAFSLMLVASEALVAGRSRGEPPVPTLSRRFPALFAFGFGLVHGLGFGGALRGIGLPESDLALALLAFNAGVELGQVAFVALLFGLFGAARAVRRLLAARAPVAAESALAAGVAHEPLAGLLQRAAAYVVGCTGAYLFVARVAALVAAFLLIGARVSHACPDEGAAEDLPIGFERQGKVWQLSLPHSAFHHGNVSERAEVAAALSPAQRSALENHAGTIALMDEIGRRQGVVLVGVGADAPFVVVPSGRSPFARLAAVDAARGARGLSSLTALLAPPSGVDVRAEASALRRVLPEYPASVLPSATFGKLVGTECNIGAREKFLLLALADGTVALLSRAGFLHYASGTERQVGADARTLGAAERWRIQRPDPYTVSLQSAAGTYLRWGARDFYELDAGATAIETAPVFQSNHERFFLWANGDGTVSLKLADNRVSVSVVEWQIPRQGMDVNCHYYGYRQDPSATPLPVSISLGSPPR